MYLKKATVINTSESQVCFAKMEQLILNSGKLNPLFWVPPLPNKQILVDQSLRNSAGLTVPVHTIM